MWFPCSRWSRSGSRDGRGRTLAGRQLGKQISGHGSHLWVKASPVDPHPVEDHRQLAGQRNARLPEARSPADGGSPVLQRRRLRGPRQHDIGRFEQQLAGETISALGDAAVDVDLARLVATRSETEIGADILRASEPVRILDGGHEADGRQRSDAGHRHHQAAGAALPGNPGELLGNGKLLLPQCATLPGSDQNAESLRQAAYLVDERGAHADQLVSRDQERTQPVRIHRANSDRPVPARADQPCQPKRVVAVRLVHLQLQRCRSMPGMKTHHRQLSLGQCVPQPHGHRARLDTDPHGSCGPPRQHGRNSVRVRSRLTVPYAIARFVHDADRGLLHRHI
ncbi:hypothetical protein WR25_15815 [Diploscapter pachys]|uniref:Uncharacterized protein n=1 Tax=Diploscapter pachys TaxID=2018661 RepID=A0A2A2JZ49_9BILA|nr:hypothetical protein WR25_15815 [Diploscapter pachys]